MSTEVHPTAIVHKEAILEDGVRVGPWSIIEKGVRIGGGCEIGPNVSITGRTSIGEDCKIYMGVSIGNPAQVKGEAEVDSSIEIGRGNTIREYVTIHRSMVDGGTTLIGDENFIMVGVHIGHDCRIGSGVVITNFAVLGGWVEVEDGAFMSGLVGVHQFVRIGELAMVGGASKLTQDVPPYMLADGHPCRIYGLNIVGLKRKGVPLEIRNSLKRAYKTIFGEGRPMKSSLDKAEEEFKDVPQVHHLVEFIRSSKRGICPTRKAR
jgi:UDP-N-acetylglucosamine acyltransferase